MLLEDQIVRVVVRPQVKFETVLQEPTLFQIG